MRVYAATFLTMPRPLTDIRQAFAVLMIAMLSLSSGAVMAADDAEARLKVAFLFNFAKFVTWPEPEFSAQPTITICISGESALGDALNGLKGKTAQGRDVVVKRDVKLEQLPFCHIAFIGGSEKDHIAKILSGAGKGVLTVSDIPAFVDAGGVIGLSVSDNKVGFDVNLEAAQQADLKISAQLLKVARGVRGKAKS
jgi:YfiR/HmsC-like